jgi:hypothetical protein
VKNTATSWSIFFIAKLSKWSKKWIEKFVKSLMKCKQTQNPDEKVVGKIRFRLFLSEAATFVVTKTSLCHTRNGTAGFDQF